MILVGDCREVMRTMEATSIDAIVTDSPYGLGFMGNGWDHAVPGIEFWAEMLRVAKPGAHLVAFGGTRTFHRLMCAIEDADWEIRDTLMWVYGSGFPKSHNGEWGGTALKPAWEPIILARKPLDGTVAATFAAHGTGGLNIDGCRIEGVKPATTRGAGGQNGRYGPIDAQGRIEDDGRGRWPANVLHDGSGEVLEAFPDAPGQQGDLTGNEPSRTGEANCYGKFAERRVFKARRDGEASAERRYTEEGGTNFAPLPGIRRAPTSAARFFYCAKASRADRNAGCEHIEPSMVHGPSGDGRCWDIPGSKSQPKANNHPTVKPHDLMRWLCRLVTPRGGG